MVDILVNLQKQGIVKNVLYAGDGDIPNFVDSTKVYFHYRTTKCDDDRTVLDDSRAAETPMELIFGKKFKLEVWETCLKTMRVKEVADFICEPKHTYAYAAVSKSLREIRGDQHGHKHKKTSSAHCCGMMAMSEEGLGHSDLDELVKLPQPLTFTIELLKVELPGQYEKEAWSMNEDEKMVAIPRLRDEGNALYREKDFAEASKKYSIAIGMLDQLQLREKPGDVEWLDLDNMKRPLLLNYSQCCLLLHDYYPVIEHCTTVIDKEPENVKALYRRAKAHVGAWNPEDARQDFHTVMSLDSSLKQSITKELKNLDELVRLKNVADKALLQGKMFK